MKTADLFVKALENEGVEYIFGIPGEENLDILQSLSKSQKIKFIPTRHEQGAGFMAATYGRLTGKPGVCLSTLGPGATNMVTPTAYAQLGAMPMVIITGQKPLKIRKQGKFQVVDVVEMMKPLTKFTKQITHGEHTASIVREAFRVAEDERPGAAHIELPEDIAKEELDNDFVFDVVEGKTPSADQETVQSAVDMIQSAVKPLLLIGASANRKSACSALNHFVKSLQIPFVNTQMGKGLIDERNELYIGTAALSDYDFVHEAIRKSDLIINVGHDIIEKPPFFMSPDDKRKVIHVNFFAAEVDEVYFPHLNVIGDIAGSINRITDLLKNKELKNETKFFQNIKKNVKEHLAMYEKDDRFPILPQRLVKICRETLAEDDMITLDNGIYKIWFARNYNAYIQNGLLLDNALASMGAGLPSAMMAKLIYPERKIVSINGDGGFMMNSQELETAARLNLDLVVIILNDKAYGMIKWKQEDEGFNDFGLDYDNPDFIKYAESFGAKGYRPNSTEVFQSILEKVLNEKGIHVIDLPVDYSLNHEILNVKLKSYTTKNEENE